MDASRPLFDREARALKFIEETCVGVDYWEDQTIRLYRGLGLVFSDGERINLTAAGTQAASTGGVNLLSAA